MEAELLDPVRHTHKVSEVDYAHFKDEKVHHVCSTFALAREIEWTTRLYIHKIKKEDEEGVGTMLEINHLAPAFEDDIIEVVAKVESFHNRELICSYEVRVGDKLIATGRTGQKLLPKSVLSEKFLREY